MQASCVRGILPARELVPLHQDEELDRFSRPRPWVCGTAALNGRDFPVMDLRGKLGLPHATHGRSPCIVVVELEGFQGPQLVGFVADRVSEVVQARERDFSRGKLRNLGRPRTVLLPEALL